MFTPLEYGCCEFSEETAIEVYKKENPEMYHTSFWPLEWIVSGRDNNICYAKIICNKFDSDQVTGFHILGPNASEIIQGFAATMKCGLTKQLLDDIIGIHPVCGGYSQFWKSQSHQDWTSLRRAAEGGPALSGSPCQVIISFNNNNALCP